MPDMWLFLDGAGGQQGPVHTKILQRLVCRTDGIPSMAWQEGMEKWEPLTSLEKFSKLIQTSYKPWSYLDVNNATVGPMKASEVVQAFSDGQIDGLTKVWTPRMEEWKAMSDVSELKEFLAHAVDDDEDGGSTREEEEEEVYDPTTMTYIGYDAEDEYAIPRFDEDARRGLLSKRVTESGEKKEVKEVRSFTGDHGINYKWCEEKQDWVVGGKGDNDGEGEDPEAEDERKTEKNNRIGKKHRLLHNSDTTANVLDEGNREPPGDDDVQTDKKRKKKNPRKKSNKPWVYVEGIPPDASEEELAAHFSKVGILDLDPMTLKPRVKIYRDENGQPKGDASICYAKNTSVGLALQGSFFSKVLDGSQLRVNVVLKVTRAVFTPLKDGKKDPAKQLQVGEARLKTARRAAKQALSWNDEDDTGMTKGLKIVILENVFDPSEIQKDKTFVHELQTDISEECEKLGPVEKITVFSRNPLGPVAVRYGTAYAAEKCIKVMDGRWFGKRQLRCHYWDGATNYVVEESHEEQEKRLEEFGDWLESQELPEEMRMKVGD